MVILGLGLGVSWGGGEISLPLDVFLLLLSWVVILGNLVTCGENLPCKTFVNAWLKIANAFAHQYKFCRAYIILKPPLASTSRAVR